MTDLLTFFGAIQNGGGLLVLLVYIVIKLSKVEQAHELHLTYYHNNAAEKRAGQK